MSSVFKIWTGGIKEELFRKRLEELRLESRYFSPCRILRLLEQRRDDVKAEMMFNGVRAINLERLIISFNDVNNERMD